MRISQCKLSRSLFHSLSLSLLLSHSHTHTQIHTIYSGATPSFQQFRPQMAAPATHGSPALLHEGVSEGLQRLVEERKVCVCVECKFELCARSCKNKMLKHNQPSKASDHNHNS